MENQVNQERITILQKMKMYEKEGFFETDLENDPPAKQLQPNQIDYLRKNWFNKLKSFIVNKKADKLIDKMIENKQIIIKDVVGEENLAGIEGSAFVTSNHFHPFENMALYKAFKALSPKKKKFYRVIREGNYTAPPMGFGLFFKHCNTLPLSSNPRTMTKFMDALEVISKKESYILIYPEQYMWWNYKKPRPFKDGAFKFACKLNRPIIPCFITMEDSRLLDNDGLPVQEYTIHIMKPIYPDQSLSLNERVKKMKEENFSLCKSIYEKTYGIELSYAGR